MRKILALAASVALLGCVDARAEPRHQTTWVTACLGEFNKSKGWIVESQDVCKFKPADAKAILRVCGKARCKVTGLAISIPRTSDVPYLELSDIMLTHITSIRLASPEEMPGN
jgi:hypothetical protein